MSEVSVCLFRSWRGVAEADAWRQIMEPPDPDEVCKPVPGTPWVKVSNRGNLYRDDFWNGHWADPVVPFIVRGYKKSGVCGKPRFVHHLILETFEGPRPPGKETRHLNDIRSDNRWPENLCWGTRSENMADRVRNGLPHGGADSCTHQRDDASTYVSPSGTVNCRLCNRDACRRYRERNRASLRERQRLRRERLRAAR